MSVCEPHTCDIYGNFVLYIFGTYVIPYTLTLFVRNLENYIYTMFNQSSTTVFALIIQTVKNVQTLTFNNAKVYHSSSTKQHVSYGSSGFYILQESASSL